MCFFSMSKCHYNFEHIYVVAVSTCAGRRLFLKCELQLSIINHKKLKLIRTRHKAYRASKVTAPLILNFGARYR